MIAEADIDATYMKDKIIININKIWNKTFALIWSELVAEAKKRRKSVNSF